MDMICSSSWPEVTPLRRSKPTPSLFACTLIFPTAVYRRGENWETRRRHNLSYIIKCRGNIPPLKSSGSFKFNNIECPKDLAASIKEARKRTFVGHRRFSFVDSGHQSVHFPAPRQDSQTAPSYGDERPSSSSPYLILRRLEHSALGSCPCDYSVKPRTRPYHSMIQIWLHPPDEYVAYKLQT